MKYFFWWMILGALVYGMMIPDHVKRCGLIKSSDSGKLLVDVASYMLALPIGVGISIAGGARMNLFEHSCS